MGSGKEIIAAVTRALEVSAERCQGKRSTMKIMEEQEKLAEYCIDDFKAGVIYATAESQNVAIKFAEWHWNRRSDRSTTELFKIFMEQVYPNLR